MSQNAATVELKQIIKEFSGLRALDQVSLQAYAGQCLGLVGENGAGKSTLMKVLSGVWVSGSYQGEILIEGDSKKFEDPQQALDAGIAIIHQELSLFENLSVAENIFMQRLPRQGIIFNRSEALERSEAILQKLGCDFRSGTLVRQLSVGQKQLVEIARAFTRPVKVLIFDEPTSALSEKEIEKLFELIADLKKRGVACIYISHKLDEIKHLCERVVVLRDGKSVAHFDNSQWTASQLIEAMVGRQIANIFPPKRPAAERPVLLKVENLSVRDPKTNSLVLDKINFEVRQGEIFGIAGLMGSKRSELLLSLFGSPPGEKISGQVLLNDKEILAANPREAIQSGFALVTEDRKLTGLFLDRSVKENLSISILRSLSKKLKIQPQKEKEIVDYYTKILRVKTKDQNSKIRNLSGGNQQKVIIGRWLSSRPQLLLLDEPTRGIDVAAKAEIYYLMRDLVDQGLTLLLVSSELPEVVSLSDRVLVMREGKVAGILEGADINPQKIMERAVA